MKQVFRVFWGCTLAAALALTGCGRGGAPGSSGAGSMSGSGSGAMSGGTAGQEQAWHTGLGVVTEAAGSDRAGCTIAVDRYRDAVVRACEQAKALGAAQGDRVTLSLIAADLPQDLAATDDQDAHVRADITLAALSVDSDGRVTSAIGDMTQPQLTVSADGTVSGPEEPVYTKNEQGDKYGMREASALHKEWYEHAEGYCSTLKGKTMAEIAAQPTDGSDADLKALCTISVTDLQKAVLAALAET